MSKANLVKVEMYVIDLEGNITDDEKTFTEFLSSRMNGISTNAHPAIFSYEKREIEWSDDINLNQRTVKSDYEEYFK